MVENGVPTEFTCACGTKCRILCEPVGMGAAVQPYKHCDKDKERYLGDPIVLFEMRDGEWVEVRRWRDR